LNKVRDKSRATGKKREHGGYVRRTGNANNKTKENETTGISTMTGEK